ncbi:hypothetical protein LA080_001028 [Diaporthe eres]|nr:hypothetical protein LA080_001028 [Diaporthe eres]
MASLPSGWKADYDGRRWFFTYGATGQSQFQFPRPGDEFPDFCCAGAAFLPAVELMPEERLESERQVRRLFDVNGGSGTAGSPGECVDGTTGFTSVKSRGRQGLGPSREVTRAVEQKGHGVCDEAGIPTHTSMAASPEESTSEPASVPLAIREECSRTCQPPSQAVGTTASIPIMSEPVLAVVETTAAALSFGHQGERPPAAVAQTSPPELPMLDGRAVDLAHASLSALSIWDVPELHSESTAPCEDEINPPPVQLPVDEGGWNRSITVSNLAFQGPIELPAYETPGASLGEGNSVVGLKSKPHAPMALAGDSAAPSNAGVVETKEKSHGHDRAGLPSQASRVSSKVPLDKTSIPGSMNAAPGQRPPTRDSDQPADKFGTEQRDLTHFPSILRPGPRRSSQPLLQQPVLVMPAPANNRSHAARVRLHEPQEQQQKEAVEAGPVSQERPARMPAMPPALHPHEVPAPASTANHEAPHPGGARQDRLPSSVNFVIPIQHISSAEPSSASGISKTDRPKYHFSASFASARPSEEPRGTNWQAGVASPGLLPGKKTESWGRVAEDEAVPTHHFVSGTSVPEVPEWSWGYAR